jgi:predicted PurR-regulated permease PerM
MYTEEMNGPKLELISFSFIFVVISLFTFFIFRPFFYIIFLAAILAVFFYPLYKKLDKVFGGLKNLTSLVVILISLFFLIVPLFFFGIQVFHEIQNFTSLSQNDQTNYLDTIQNTIEHMVQHFYPTFSFNINEYINSGIKFLSENLSGLAYQTAYIFLNIFLVLLVLFFFLRDGRSILSSTISLSPFSTNSNTIIIQTIQDTINSVLKGTLFVSLIRWLVVGIGFYLFGIPNPILWGSVAGIIGAIPGLGTAFSIIPAVMYLFSMGNVISALLLFVFGVIVIIFIDNMLTAYYFSKGLYSIPSVFVLFSIIGGLFYFGPLGFIFGPLILSLLISMLRIYKILVLQK